MFYINTVIICFAMIFVRNGLRCYYGGSTEITCSMAVPAMSTRPRTSALQMPSTHPIRNANHR